MPSIPIVFPSDPGRSLGYSARRLSDGRPYDHADGTFKELPATRVAALPEGTGPDAGRYAVTLATDPADWPDDWYEFAVHDLDAGSRTVGDAVAWIPGGDGLAPPATGGGGGASGPVAVATASVTAIADAIQARPLGVSGASITAIAGATADLVGTGGGGGGGTGPVTVAPASIAAIAAATWARTLYGSITAGRALWTAAASGGGGVAINETTGAVTIKGPDQGAICITAQVTYPGNRTVTLNFPF